ncbi:hypothetical protein [Phytoactinopolyspora endophytica]|uniref:hypothetical protein n=1 Tax=Phytoactinopolyspora endophytica TaxID=1642495 RepID=UPI00101CDE8A|nr:hypothetical protein [Phytoactinopolyspora endophytica]
MRTQASSVLLTTLVLALTACGDDDTSGVSPEDCDGPPEVTVLDQGDEPREVMEMSPTVGDSATVDIQTGMSIDTGVDSESASTDAVPMMQFGMTTTVDEVTDDEIKMSFVYDEGEADGDAVTESMSSLLVGVSGTLTTTRSGAFVDAEVTTDGSDPMLTQMVGQLEQMLGDMTTPFPTEPLGPGAEWDIVSSHEVSNATFCNTASYTLADFDGDAYELDVEVSQQVMPATAEEDGQQVVVEDYTASGSGTTRGRLSFPMAVSGSSSVTSETEMTLEQDGTEQTEQMTTEVTTEITPRE